jgi:hypothetical protein
MYGVAADPASRTGGDEVHSPGRWAGSREMRFRLLSMTDSNRTRLLPLGSLGSFGACFVVWQYEIDVAHT